MFLKNSIKSLYRSPIKSFLLIVILGITVFVWELGMSTWLDINSFLNACDEAYVTSGVVEYIPKDPNIMYLDELQENITGEQFLKLGNNDGVLFSEESKELLGTIEGYERKDLVTPAQDEAVLVITGAVPAASGNAYQARVFESLFANRDLTGKTVLIADANIQLDSEQYYIVYGVQQEASVVLTLFLPTDYQVESTKEMIPGIAPYNIQEDIPKDYQLLADSLAVNNSGIMIQPTKNLESFFEFQQNIQTFTEGRIFTEEEYETGAKVCVINEIVAERLGKQVGDQIQLSWVNDGSTLWSSYWEGTGYSESEPFEIVGITNRSIEYSYQVYVPDAKRFSQEKIIGDKEVFRMILDNRTASKIAKEMQQTLGDSYRLLVYDQGYAQTAGAYISIQNVAVMIVFAVSILSLAAMFLISYVCVYRRSELTPIMLRLGCERKQIIRFYTYTGMTLGFFGIVIGTIGAIVSRQRVFDWMQRISNEKIKLDLRYSDFGLSMQRKSLSFELSSGYLKFVLMACLMMLVTSTVVFLFSRKVSEIGKKNNRSIRLQKEPKIHVQGYLRGSIGFATKQMVRSQSRTLGVLLLGFAVAVFAGRIVTAATESQANLDTLLHEQQINGYMADYHGNISNRLVLNTEDIAQILQMKRFDSISASAYEGYVYLGIAETKDGQEGDWEPLKDPETIAEVILRGKLFASAPQIYFTNNIRTSPKFLYENDVTMTFLDGYDETFLEESYQERFFGPEYTVLGMISSKMAEDENIELGDIIYVEVARSDPYGESMKYPFKVVGLYENINAEEDIFLPLDIVREINDFWGRWLRSPYSINSLSFRINGVSDISTAKDALSLVGFEEVGSTGSSRKYVLLEDGIALSNLSSMEIQDRYTRVLVVIMVILAASANIFLSGALIRGRKTEMGVMMGMGARGIQIFWAFALELCIVYLAGNIFGFLLLTIFTEIEALQVFWYLVAIACCFLFGCTYGTIKILHNGLSENMKDVEES